MTTLELLLAGGLAGIAAVIAYLRIIASPISDARSYKCKELVRDDTAAVTYRDSPMVECGQSIKLLVHGDCTPFCPKHNKAMTRLV